MGFPPLAQLGSWRNCANRHWGHPLRDRPRCSLLESIRDALGDTKGVSTRTLPKVSITIVLENLNKEISTESLNSESK